MFAKEKRMKETKTIQCYPNDREINETINVYGDFGWELVSNQHCQTQDSDTYYTFNKLTFSREKASPWYEEVTALEKKYYELDSSRKSATYLPEPELPKAAYALFILLLWGLLIILIWNAALKAKYKKQKAELEASTRDFRNQCWEQMQECRAKSSALVNA